MSLFESSSNILTACTAQMPCDRFHGACLNRRYGLVEASRLRTVPGGNPDVFLLRSVYYSK